MEKLKTLGEVARALGKCELPNPDHIFGTVANLVDSLIDLGSADKVFVRHDDHLGLKENLSGAFLDEPLEDMDEQRFEEEIQLVLEQANIIIPLSERSLSDDEMEDIDEDRAYRGTPNA